MPKEVESISNNDLSDSRYFPRWEVENRVLFQLDDEQDTLEAKTKDISCAGACIYSNNKEFKPEQKVKLVIYLTKTTFVTLTGKIVWIKPFHILKEIGVHFENVALKTQDTILEHAFEIRHSEVINNWYKGWKA